MLILIHDRTKYDNYPVIWAVRPTMLDENNKHSITNLCVVTTFPHLGTPPEFIIAKFDQNTDRQATVVELLTGNMT